MSKINEDFSCFGGTTAKGFAGLRGFAARTDNMIREEACISRKFRLMIEGRDEIRDGNCTMREWPVELSVMTHGKPIAEDAPGLRYRAFCEL